MPEISVIVPVYNTETYLRRCVDSILAQTFTDFELILIDDGSTDNSGAICDEYAENDRRAKVIHQSNAGVSAARNRALNISKGEYVSFVDGDDWLSPVFLESVYLIIQETDSDICVARIKRTVNETNIDSNEPVSYYTCGGREAVSLLGEENSERFRAVLGKVIRRRIAVSAPFPEGRSWSEDSAVVYKWLFEAKIVTITNLELYFYRMNQAGATANRNPLSKLGIVDTYSEMIAFFIEHGFDTLLEKYSYLYADNLAFLYYSLDRHQAPIRRKLKKTLKRLLFDENTKKFFSVRKTPYPYEVLFPIYMRAYYLLKPFIIL